MLERINFENYKAFQSASLEIKPITILLGANSVGKSSILQLLLMINQTTSAGSNYKSALKLNGGFANLGESINLFRKKDISKPLKIEFEIIDESLLELLNLELIKEFNNSLISNINVYHRIKSNISSNSNSSKKITDIFFPYFSSIKNNLWSSSKDKFDVDLLSFFIERNQVILSQNDLSKILDIINEEATILKALKDDDTKYLLDGFRFNYRYPFMTQNNLKDRKEEFLYTYELLENIKKLNLTKKFKLAYTFELAKNKSLKVSKIELSANSKLILSIEFDHSTNISQIKKINLPLIVKNKDFKRNYLFLNKIFDFDKSIFSFIRRVTDMSDNKNTSVLAYFLNSILEKFSISLLNTFNDNKINYVSPLRAPSKRYYFLDKAKSNKYFDTFDGDAIAEILNDNHNLKSQVNNWFEKFNLNINVSQLQDIIHRLIVKQNTMDLEISDVGFGISQVLPVIIQSILSKNESITIVEQPEIHLHPKMQADLADLFIDIVTNSKVEFNKFLLIETHSEYLLKRLRRRISEGKISAKNVAIYLVEPENNNGGAILRELKIEEKGAFEWPKDFYGGELLKDDTVFFVNQ